MRAKSTPMREALRLWRKVTGVRPNAKTMQLGNWTLHDSFEQIEEALALDPTEITATLLLTHFVNTYLETTSASLASLIKAPGQVADRLADLRKLLDILSRPAIVQARDNFLEALRKAVQRYDAADRKDVRALLDRPDEIAILRRDALRSMSQLRVDQFLDGPPEPPEVSPVYHRTVHQWWNVNSLLAAATRMPSGVALNLIRDPDAFQSYFCFAIRNGGSLFVLSDAPEHEHPLQGRMSRRPDRALNKRAGRNWFPYELLDLEYDKASGRLYVKQTSSQTALVPYQNEALPLKPIAALDPPEIIWIAMMFDLILERFWKRGYKAPALSYTAEMLKVDTALLDVARTAKLPVQAYQPVGLAPLTRANVSSSEAGEDEIGKMHHRPNAWMEERYGHLVPEEALNLVASPEATSFLEQKSGAITQVPAREIDDLAPFEHADLMAGKVSLESVNATSFGTREQLEKDRRFIARCNFATHIDALARAEFEERKGEVHRWYHERVEANIEHLLSWAGNKELWIADGVHPGFSHWERHAGPCRSTQTNPGGWQSSERIEHSLIRRYTIGSDYFGFNLFGSHYIGATRGRHLLCYLNGTKATYSVLFAPTNEAELALLAGCAVGDLPDVIQHWSLFRRYTGNSILQRVDPMIWRASNPWIELDMRIHIAFSKRGMAEIEKRTTKPDLPGLLP